MRYAVSAWSSAVTLVCGLQGVLYSADVTYEQALRTALAKNNMSACNTITEGLWLGGDAIYAGDEPRRLCKVEFAATKKKPELCLRLPAEPVGHETLRDACLRKLARTMRQPELCERLNTESRDECRAQAITEVAQCSEGFHDETWFVSMRHPDRCIEQVAENQRNATLCHSVPSLDGQRNCLRNVDQLREEDALLAPKPRSDK